MHYLVAGVSHQGAPLERLERLVVSQDTLPEILLQASRHLGEAVILSTCHRTEVYSVSEDRAAGERRLREFLDRLDRRRDEPPAPLDPFVYVLTGDDAMRHIFRVASGLDSMVIGEPEIVGQVAGALRAAGEAGTVSHRLSRLFHHALRASRRARSRTGVARHSLSISSIGVHLLQRAVGDLEEAAVLLAGVGETGKLAARALKRSGVKTLTVASRRTGRAAEAAAELGATALAMSDVPGALADCDVLVTCTAARDPVITADAVRTAMSSRTGRPLFILDLALPADVEAAAAGVPSVTLFGLSDLTEIAAEHRAGREDAAREAEELVSAEVSHFKEILTGEDAEPLIRALGERAEVARARELERALKNLPQLDRDSAGVIDAMSRAIVKRLLADPIAFLRAGGDLDTAAILARAFDIAGAIDIDDASGPEDLRTEASESTPEDPPV